MAKEVKLPKSRFKLEAGMRIFSMDIQYAGERDAYVAIDVLEWKSEEPTIYLHKSEATMEYIPGLFAFREGPCLLKAIEALEQEVGISADLLIIDGHGIAHPRKFGVACWLGLKTGIPSIGCAKRSLLPYETSPENSKGSTSNIVLNGETLGYALRSVVDVKPIFVSPGHLINLAASKECILALCGEYRVIEPIRRADKAARAFAKGEVNGIKCRILK